MDFPRTIYAITHNQTHRTYIGSSKNPAGRIESHLCALRRGCHPVEDMQADFDAFGEDYTIDCLEVVTKFDDRFREYEWMKTYRSHVRGVGYNYKDRYFQEIPKNPKVEYRNRINKLVRSTDDVALLDLVCKLLEKSVSK